MHRAVRSGFTIVELLIVIVVIAILAAITIVAYNGIQSKSRDAAVVADTAQIMKKLEVFKTTAPDGQYPADLSSLNLQASQNTVNYYFNSVAKTFCLTVSNGPVIYSASSSDKQPISGSCTRSGIASWWNFNGNANDSARLGANGTVINATLTTGQNGQANSAYLFNGSNTSIGLSNAAINTGPKLPLPVTVSAWVNHTGSGSPGTIFSSDQYGCAGSVFNYTGYNINIGSTNGFNVNTGSGDGCSPSTRYSRSTAGSTVPANQWVNVIAVFESFSSYTLYVNGVSSGGSYTGTAKPVVYTNTVTSRIGTRSDGTERFNGSLDDLRVYDRALTADEAQMIFSEGAQ